MTLVMRAQSARWKSIGVFALVAAGACGDAEPADDTPRPLPPDSVSYGLPPSRNPDVPVGAVGSTMESEVVVATVEPDGIRLSRDTVPAGQVTVRVENRTDSACALELTSQFSGRHRTAPVRTGASVQMSMALARAPYRLYCLNPTGDTPADTLRLIVR